MASSNIKLFDENKGNMLSDSEFSISNQRMNGLQTGVASSQLQNKAMYQVSLVAYAIAQVMMQNGLNANDTDAVSAFVANLSGTMLQKVYDLATTAEAQAGVATGKWMSPALVKAAIDTLAAKANNILSSSTKALYGLGDNATPDDVLALLSRFQAGLGNEYVWSKTKIEDSEKYDIAVIEQFAHGTAGAFYYSDSFHVEGNQFVLDNPQSATPSASLDNAIKGKYFYSSPSATAMRKMPEDAVITDGSPITVSYVFSYTNARIETGPVLYGYVNSPDPAAYPPAVSDGYTYTALGQLGNKVKIELISYVGTNTYGENNPTILTFDFKPKFLWFVGQGLVSGDQPFSPAVPSGNFYTWFATENTPTTPTNRVGFGNPNNIQGWMSADGKTLTWFNYSTSNASDQLNSSNARYYYIAIG